MAAVVVARSFAPSEQASDQGPSGQPTREVMEAVQRSCRAVADRPVRLAEVFYQHLFEMAPATRAMFAVDMTEQMQKMTDTLLAAIAQLSAHDTRELQIVLHRMGREHYQRYQVEPEHYMYIAHALTRAVREVSGWEYTSHLSSCWIAVCQWVTHHMVAGTHAAMEDAASPARAGAGPDRSAAIPSPRPAPVGPAAASTRSGDKRRSPMGRVRS